MKILVVGGGGREHAICWKIQKSPLVEKIYCAPGNAGISSNAECIDLKADDISGLLKFAVENSIDLTVVGPELPLSLGIVDLFGKEGMKIFGPDMKAAEIESSKVFSKDLMKKYSIPTAEYEIFDKYSDAVSYIDNIEYPVVVKADGLAAGKGVFICNERQSSLNAINSIMKEKEFGESGSRVVIEEFLKGEEASFFVLTDGDNYIPLETSQDHKAIYDGDKGPNTGGMGAYSPAPVISSELMKNRILEEIAEPTLSAMKKEGRKYSGVLYIGLMISESGPKVLEYNCRLGDPETQPLLVRMDSDIVPVLDSIAGGHMEQKDIKWKENASVCVVMSSEGYPGKYEKGNEIKNIEKLEHMDDIYVFHSGTKLSDGKLVNSGGRVLGVTSLGNSIADARKKAYMAVKLVDNDFLYFRKDIGLKALKHEI